MVREAPKPPNTEKPLPELRPGTSGTEAVLRTNLRTASDNFQRAQAAERAYRSKKRAGAARRDFADARLHLHEARVHFVAFLRLLFSAARGSPYLLVEKKETLGAKWEEKKLLKEEKKAMQEKRKAKDKTLKTVDTEPEEGEGEEYKMSGGAEKGAEAEADGDHDGDMNATVGQAMEAKVVTPTKTKSKS